MHMNFSLIATLLVAGFFAGMLLFLEIGRRIGFATRARHPDGWKGVGTAEGAIFGLLGLLIAFTFSGAASRFEDRRHLVTAEANAIGTAYLRIDQLPAAAQPEIRDLFRRYLDLRLATYGTFRNVVDIAGAKAKLDETETMQGEIWNKAVAACRMPDALPSAPMLMLPALNEMIDIVTTRFMATRNHPPLVIYLLLTGLSLMGSLLVGYEMSDNKDRNWLHMLVFAGVLTVTVFVIIDLEFPRLGFIKVDAADQVLVDLRKSML
jgi:hypothetical protein